MAEKASMPPLVRNAASPPTAKGIAKLRRSGFHLIFKPITSLEYM
jgi:hypothetical protein